MPDRAVVDERKVMCRECGGWFPTNEARAYCVVRDGGDEYPGTVLCEMCLGDVELDDDVERVIEEADEGAPRALVALSEDRQWLVMLDVAGDASEWTVRRKHLDDYVPAHFAFRMDTGQDANEVLADFLREAQQAKRKEVAHA